MGDQPTMNALHAMSTGQEMPEESPTDDGGGLDQLSAAILTQGEDIKSMGADIKTAILSLAETLSSDQEVVRDSEGRVKGSRRKPKE